MRELLVIIILLSAVSSEEFEPKKRHETPPEEDPNFWPARGRRSFWNNHPRLFSNLIERDISQNSDIDYAAGYSRTWPSRSDYISNEDRVLGLSESWRYRICPRKKSISLILPLQEFRTNENEVQGCGGRCDGGIRGRGRRGDERRRRPQPLYAEEPGWIAIDIDQSILGGSNGNEDPFIVTRGKKRGEELFDLRERRHFEDLISNSYDADPFFVARGKRNAKNGESKSRPAKQSLVEKFPTNKQEFRPRNPRTRSKRSSSESERRNHRENSTEKSIESTKNEDKVSRGAENSKFPNNLTTRKSGDDEKLLSKSSMIEKGNYHRPERSSSLTDEIFQNGDYEDIEKWKTDVFPQTESALTQKNELGIKQARYLTAPRDKHSNLQSILDEPFFISRGKKDSGVEYLRYDGRGERSQSDEIFSEIMKFYNAGYFGEPNVKMGTSSLYSNDGLQFLGNLVSERVRKSKGANKPPRNRRGMLEELLKSDDPFYVARGKKFFDKNHQPRSKVYDIRIDRADNDAAASNGKFSLFSKTIRTKLLQKLSQFSKLRPGILTDRNVFNATDNSINDIN